MKYSARLPHEFRLNALAQLLVEKHKSGVEILDLTESNPTRAGIEYPPGFLAALADERALRYDPEPFGMPAARELIAREYGAPPDRVVITASTSEAYSWLFKLLCDPGCEILVPRPSYPLFDYLAAFESAVVRPYSLFYDHGWFIDFNTIERALNERTRALIVVNPNNPTGNFLHAHELGELTALCAKRDIALIADEVFVDYAFEAPLSLAGIADFTLNGLSKTVGLPQMKLGWIIAKDPPERLEMIADTYLSVGTPVQCALPSLLALRDPVRQQILQRARANLALLKRALVIEGGWYAVIPVMDEEETAEGLLRDRNVLVQPGYFYDFERPGYLVLSLLTEPAVFREGAALLDRYL